MLLPSAANFWATSAPRPLLLELVVALHWMCLVCGLISHREPPVTRTLRPCREYGMLDELNLETLTGTTLENERCPESTKK